MRLLDLQYRRGGKQPCQHAHLPAGEPFGDQIDDQHGQQVEERREPAPNLHHLHPAHHLEEVLGQVARGNDREIAVDVEPVPAVDRVER